MAVIAVVGGTGNVGRTIVDALKQDGKHKVIVLTRKVSDNSEILMSAALSLSQVRSKKELVPSQRMLLITTILSRLPKLSIRTMSAPLSQPS